MKKSMLAAAAAVILVPQLALADPRTGRSTQAFDYGTDLICRLRDTFSSEAAKIWKRVAVEQDDPRAWAQMIQTGRYLAAELCYDQSLPILHGLAVAGKYRLLAALVRDGNYPDERGLPSRVTPLELVVATCDSPKAPAELSSVVDVLLKSGADPHRIAVGQQSLTLAAFAASKAGSGEVCARVAEAFKANAGRPVFPEFRPANMIVTLSDVAVRNSSSKFVSDRERKNAIALISVLSAKAAEMGASGAYR